MDDAELYREQILRHSGPVITGRFVGFQTAYAREVKIGRPLVLLIFVAATTAYLLVAMLRSGSRGARRTWKELKKGPEFLVTPIRTTLQPFTPRIPTMWSHLGPALLIQAVAGAAVAALVVAAWMR
jgi:hypothetical protein